MENWNFFKKDDWNNAIENAIELDNAISEIVRLLQMLKEESLFGGRKWS